MLLIDDYSRMMWATFLREKFESVEKFKIFMAMVETKTGLKIKCLRSDRGGEFTSGEFNSFCEEHGIKRQLSAADPSTKWSCGKEEQNSSRCC